MKPVSRRWTPWIALLLTAVNGVIAGLRYEGSWQLFDVFVGVMFLAITFGVALLLLNVAATFVEGVAAGKNKGADRSKR